MNQLQQELMKPFPLESVSWRVGSTNRDKSKGMALAYIDARDVMDRLDQVVGFNNWQDEYIETIKGRVICRIGIKVGDEWIYKSDGAGDTSYEGEKGAISDAFKRAAVKFGIGRYLYSLKAPWVEVEERGRTVVIKKHEYAKLRAVLGGNSTLLSPRQEAPQFEDLPSASRQPSKEVQTARAIKSGMPTDKMRKAFYAIGNELYGPDWDSKRKELCLASTGELSDSSKDLNFDQMSRLIDGMKKKLEG
jgi:recombination DNA repair RAD52 pathway protein